MLKVRELRNALFDPVDLNLRAGECGAVAGACRDPENRGSCAALLISTKPVGASV